MMGLLDYSPEFYDRFGIFVFLFTIISSAYMIRTTKKFKNKWLLWVQLIIGILGIIVDSNIVATIKPLFLGA